MGVDAKLFISNRWQVQDIIDVVDKRFNAKAYFENPSKMCDYGRVSFDIEGTNRSISVHNNSVQGGFTGMLLTLRANTQGQGILIAIAQSLGGIYQEKDSDEDYQVFDVPGHGNAQFLLDEAIKQDPSLGDDIGRLAAWLADRAKE